MLWFFFNSQKIFVRNNKNNKNKHNKGMGNSSSTEAEAVAETKTLSREDSIRFWCEIMEEHMDFIVTALDLSSISATHGLVTVAARFKEKWSAAALKATMASTNKNIVPLKEGDELITHTRAFKRRVRTELQRTAGAECWVDLLTHMMEELDMLQYFLSVEQPDLLYELRRWTREHQEAELFLICQVPKFLEKPSPLLEQAAVKNKLIADELGRFGPKATHSPQSKAEFLELAAKHDANAKAFLRDVLPRLPLTESLRKGVGKMVEHEIKEAQWARLLIESLPSQPSS